VECVSPLRANAMIEFTKVPRIIVDIIKAAIAAHREHENAVRPAK